MNTIIWVVASVILVCQPNLGNSPSNPQESEHQILSHYEGTWDCTFEILPQAGQSEAKQFTGIVTGKWVLGDKFLEQTGNYQLNQSSPPLEIRTLMTYDPKQKRYQYDYFNSTGNVQRSFGQWDAESKTMTSTMIDDGNGNKTTIVANFSKLNVERWTIETMNSQGQSVLKISGTNTRRGEK